MTEYRTILERDLERVTRPAGFTVDDVRRRRDRKRRNQRIAAGFVGIAVFVAAVWIVTGVAPFDEGGAPAGDPTGPAQTGPGETGPVAVGSLPEPDFVLHLNTGDVTPLPKSIVGTEDRAGDYAVSPDGSTLAYAVQGNNGDRNIFVANLDGTGVKQMTNDLYAGKPAWSPDGSKIAFIGRLGPGPNNVYVLDLASGSSTQVTFHRSLGIRLSTPSFTPDASFIVYGSYAGNPRVRMVPTLGGKSVVLVEGGAEPQLSPDGSLLAYDCHEGIDIRRQEGICLANADGTNARMVVKVDLQGAVTRWSPDGRRIAYTEFDSRDVLVVDVTTGEVTRVASGTQTAWLDDHTLIVEAP
jgi:Tol biopolymer transport system component